MRLFKDYAVGSEYYKHCLGLERSVRNLGSNTICKSLISASLFDCKILLDQSQADLRILYCGPVLLLIQLKRNKGPAITHHRLIADECGPQILTWPPGVRASTPCCMPTQRDFDIHVEDLPFLQSRSG